MNNLKPWQLDVNYYWVISNKDTLWTRIEYTTRHKLKIFENEIIHNFENMHEAKDSAERIINKIISQLVKNKSDIRALRQKDFIK